MQPSKISAIVLAISALAAPVAAQNIVYANGGNPSDHYSCYSHCGAKTSATQCYCDEGCEIRGNCCADRDEFCPAKVVQPACSLTNNITFSKFCGTDLGFVFQHGSQLDVLFGDSWERTSSGTCVSRGADFVTGDDSQGWLPVTRPAPSLGVPARAADIYTNASPICGSILQFDRTPTSGTPYNYTTVKLQQESGTGDLAMPPGYTPLAGFSDGTRAWALFLQGGSVIPPIPPHVYVGYRPSESTRTQYKARVDLGTASKFVNSSTTRITQFSETNSNLTSNFTTPTGSQAGELLLFGRPRFWSDADDNASDNRVYLAHQPLPLTVSGAKNWAPRFFTGISTTTGQPTWGTEANAKPLFNDDFKATNQIDIKWIPQLKKWVMLYGGDLTWFIDPQPTNDAPRHGAIHMRMADYPWGPWTRATPLLWRESMRGYIKCNAPPNQGCDKTGTEPGSDQLQGTWRTDISGAVPSCAPGLPLPIQPNGNGVDECSVATSTFPFFANSQHQRGIMYAAELLPTWTNPGAYDFTTRLITTTLYFLVSTWMPYQVVLAAADITLPVNELPVVPLVQLRDHNNRMITLSSTSTPSSTAGGTQGGATAWYVKLADGTFPSRSIQIGDTVTFTSASNNGASYLSRNNPNLRFDPAPVTPLQTRMQWVLESTNTTLYPNGTPIVFGKTPFRMLNFAANPVKRLRSIAGVGLQNTGDPPGDDASWKMTWACTSDDTCAP